MSEDAVPYMFSIRRAAAPQLFIIHSSLFITAGRRERQPLRRLQQLSCRLFRDSPLFSVLLLLKLHHGRLLILLGDRLLLRGEDAAARQHQQQPRQKPGQQGASAIVHIPYLALRQARRGRRLRPDCCCPRAAPCRSRSRCCSYVRTRCCRGSRGCCSRKSSRRSS